MSCADENFFPCIDICEIQINKYSILFYSSTEKVFGLAWNVIKNLFGAIM